MPTLFPDLRRCLRDLAVLMARPAVRSAGRERRRIAHGAADLLVDTLRVDLAHVRFTGSAAQGPVEASRFENVPQSPERAAWIERALPASLTDRLSATMAVVLPDPQGEGQVYAAVTPIGEDGQLGVMLAGSQRPQFPADEDRITLDVIAAQLALALQRVRAENALERHEAELADSFEHAVVGMQWVGPDGTILRVNQTELDLLGYEREELVGRSVGELHVDRRVADEMLLRLHAGEVLRETEARLRCKDNSIKHVLVNSNVLWDDGQFVHSRWFIRDITEQKRAEAALRRSETQLRLVVDRAPVYLARCDRSRRFQFVNMRYAERFGEKPEALIGKTIDEALGQEAYETIRGYIETVLSGWRVEFEVEIPYRRIGRRVMHCTYEPDRAPSGEVEGWIAVVVDVTDRKHADSARALLAAVVESSDDAIVTKTLDGKILSWNPGAERIFGHTASEMIGQPITQLIPPDRQEEERHILARIGRGERIEHYETERLTKDGRRIAVSLTISPLFDMSGRIIGASKIARDITARRESAEALRRSEERFRLMAEAVPSMLWSAAPDGTITYASQRYLTYVGLTLEPHALDFFDRTLHPDDRARWAEVWGHARRDGAPVEAEVRVRRHDGEHRRFVTRATPLRDSSGAVVQWCGTTTEIDDRRPI